MNAVWNSYGQLCGCPEIFKKSCKFFCRELDIRVSKPMGISAYKVTSSLPEELQRQLPSIEDIEKRIQRE